MKDKLFSYLNNKNVVLAVAIFFMGYIAFNTIGIISRNYRLQEQVDGLEEEIEILKLKNQELEFKIAYFGTSAFVDKEARDKLGLQAPGERVLIFPDKLAAKTEVKPVSEDNQPQAISNFQQWMYFLLRREPSMEP